MPAQRPAIVGVKISAGLGNQMFQYAAGLALAERLGAELVCDIRHYEYEDRGDRGLGLPVFGIELKPARVPPFRPLRQLSMALGLQHANFRQARVLLQVEKYEPEFEQLTAPAVLAGYFQSWRFFAGHEASVRRVFDTRRLATDRIAAVAAEIAAARHPVAVHVRRGDYLKDARSAAYFGVLDTGYYNAARAALEARVNAPTYFLFSDEIGRAADELRGWPGLRPVTGFTGPEDLHLMSLCRHFIIANSTFSWWGAWLGTARDKLVAGPRRWFGPGYPHRVEIDDRLPLDWIRV